MERIASAPLRTDGEEFEIHPCARSVHRARVSTKNEYHNAASDAPAMTALAGR
jgi:hypothetical protein